MNQLADRRRVQTRARWQSGHAAHICRVDGAHLPPLASFRALKGVVGGQRRPTLQAYLFQDSVKTVEDGTFGVAQSADNSQKTQE